MCHCQRCTLCKIRGRKHEYYLERKAEVKARTQANYLRRKRAGKLLEVTDAELDRKALEWLEARNLR